MAKILVCAPIVGSTTEDRALIEHQDGGWSVGRIARADRAKFTREFSFRIEDLLQAATWAFEGSEHVKLAMNNQAGKGLAAGCLLLALALKLPEADEEATPA